MTETLLVPIDFSDCANEVVGHAARLAGGLGAKVVLLHAIDPPKGLGADPVVQGGPGGEPVHLAERLRSDAEQAMARFAEEVSRAGGHPETRIERGKPAQVILQAAKDVGASLIVMGTHGRKGLQRLLLGSVSETVMRHADVPVVTVRSHRQPDCAARNCGVCRSGTTPAMEQALAELDG